MLFRTFAYTLTVVSILSFPARAQDRDAQRPALKPRVEGNLRAGTERSIAMTEFWVPLAQDNAAGSVLYGDARFMGDDKENNEFNLGVGYRKIVADVPVLGNGVAGVHGWVDRRHTERGSAFNQITTGAEWHGEAFDIKANAYIPLNKSKTHSGTGTSAPYLAGSGIFYDITNMTLVEEAQPGFDLELGINVSGIVEGFADSARVYAGAYHFAGDKTDDVTGYRARIASDITSDVQLGARFQRDDERGSQGFLEATIRFPFGNKQSYKKHGLYARLDESPERDIDIVTSSAKPSGAGNAVETKPVLNANSGDPQRVLYVDNQAAGGGTGGKDDPFNTLAAAQAILADNDVVYVARGNGLTTGMQDGFLINRNNVTMIGSGSAFIYDGGKFSTSDGTNFTGTLLRQAGLAPIISNTNPVVGAAGTDSGNITGNAISVTGSNAYVSGFSLIGAQGAGLRAWYNGTTSDSLRLNNLTVSGNQLYGVTIRVWNNGVLTHAMMDDVIIHDNVNHGLYVTPQSGGDIMQFTGRNITTYNNSGAGMQMLTFTATSLLDNVFLDRIKAYGNNTFGVQMRNGSGIMNTVAIQNSDIYNNGQAGLFLDDDTAGQNPVFDIGGGGLSIGYNRIYNNALSVPAQGDVRLDLDGGTAIMHHNWWGTAVGLLPARWSSEGACPGSCGTPDALNPLGGDPRP